tara:strand:- start:367 stop:945 length:579 start_codon:yes stop_codon:yes gene_type:complete
MDGTVDLAEEGLGFWCELQPGTSLFREDKVDKNGNPIKVMDKVYIPSKKYFPKYRGTKNIGEVNTEEIPGDMTPVYHRSSLAERRQLEVNMLQHREHRKTSEESGICFPLSTSSNNKCKLDRLGVVLFNSRSVELHSKRKLNKEKIYCVDPDSNLSKKLFQENESMYEADDIPRDYNCDSNDKLTRDKAEYE